MQIVARRRTCRRYSFTGRDRVKDRYLKVFQEVSEGCVVDPRSPHHWSRQFTVDRLRQASQTVRSRLRVRSTLTAPPTETVSVDRSRQFAEDAEDGGCAEDASRGRCRSRRRYRSRRRCKSRKICREQKQKRKVMSNLTYGSEMEL